MPLESLSEEQINIHDLTLEQEKTSYKSEQIFKSLKASNLFEKNLGQWRHKIMPDQSLHPIDSERETEDQLVGVLAECLFDKQKGRKRYDFLKNKLFNNTSNSWSNSFYSKSTAPMPIWGLNTQLWGVVTENMFDKEKAQTTFLNLKKRYHGAYPVSHWTDDKINSSSLLGVYAEGLFDKESAQIQYEELKNSSFFDKKTNRWNLWLDLKNKYCEPEKSTENQLMGVLIETLFNKTHAKEIFEQLKDGPLYNKNTNQWVSSVDKHDQVHNRSIESIGQLLGVICEHEFEEPNPNLHLSAPNLPETRSY